MSESIWKTIEPEPVPRLALSSEEASKALGVSKRTLDQLAIENRLPSFRIGSRRLFGVDTLRRWIAEQSEKGGPENDG